MQIKLFANLSLALLLTIICCLGCNHSVQNQHSAQEKQSQEKQSQKNVLIKNDLRNNKDISPLESIRPFIPTQLIIPAIKVSAKVVPIGVLDSGQMDVPKDTEIVGFLYPGVLAGTKGNMIMDGHVDSYTGPAVFFDLKKLNPGDAVIVRNQHSDRSMTFRVESVEAFKTTEAPIERIFGQTDEHHLNLITCTGKYSRKKKEHEERLVVFTKLDGGE